jgi:peroxiredoxin
MKYFWLMFILLLLSAINCDNSSPRDNSSTVGATPATTANDSPATTKVSPNNAALDSLPVLQTGNTLPSFNLTSVTGQSLSIGRGPQLLIIYAPDCKICHATMPRWITLYQQFFRPRNIPLMAVSIQDAPATLRSIRELQIPFPVAASPDIDFRLGRRLTDIPATLAIDAQGTVSRLWLGNLPNAQLAEVINTFCPECNVQVNQPPEKGN